MICHVVRNMYVTDMWSKLEREKNSKWYRLNALLSIHPKRNKEQKEQSGGIIIKPE